MISPPSYPIFTTVDITPRVSLSSFTLFPTLPAELRIKIWHTALQQQRILRLRLRDRWLVDGLLEKQGDTRPQTHEDERYGVVVYGYQTLSKLFRVSQESREAALVFYRVHLTCWLVKGSMSLDSMKPGILHFNPEYDFLQISNDTGHIPDFLHDLKTVHDPRHVGLLNLAVDRNDLKAGDGFCNIQYSSLDPQIKSSFTKTLAQLREVFFVQVQRVGRDVFGMWMGARSHEYTRCFSFPITAKGLSFDRLQLDPRPIDQDLRSVFVNADPYEMLHAWAQLLLECLGDCNTLQTEYRVLLTFSPTFSIYDRRSGEEWLQEEQKIWIEESTRDGRSWQVPASALEASVRTSFGFWLFPVQAFGGFPERLDDDFRNQTPLYMDLKDYWPEIALLDLP